MIPQIVFTVLPFVTALAVLLDMHELVIFLLIYATYWVGTFLNTVVSMGIHQDVTQIRRAMLLMVANDKDITKMIDDAEDNADDEILKANEEIRKKIMDLVDKLKTH